MRSLNVATRARLGASAAMLLLGSCASVTPSPTPTSTPLPATATSTLTPLPTETVAPTPRPAPARPLYSLATVIEFDAHTLSVDETIVYPNRTGEQLTGLVLAIVPNLWPDCFRLDELRVDGVPATEYSITGQRLDLLLPNTLMPDSTVTVSIRFSLSLPFIQAVDPNVSRPRIFGYSKLQMNLTNWYPFVVPHVGGEWILHEPWYYGEHLVYEAADFVVDVRFSDAASAPVVAASGSPQPQADFTRYTLTSGRTFAISASREFQVATLQAGDVTVASYAFPFFQGESQAAAQVSAQALELYSQRFGPYPHKTLSVVMGDFNDGMEFSAFFFLPKDFYNLYNETAPHSYLVSVAVHETAHQWWFEQVANDQALQPWLDEALATYSERLYYETYRPDQLGSWWGYRIDFFNPQGFVDVPIFKFQGFRPYTDAVYFRGAHFLEDLRTRIGDEAFFAFLQDYLARERMLLASPVDFFGILRSHTQTDYADLVRQYFQNTY